eukprot:3316694-Prymnesium_polylepis.4
MEVFTFMRMGGLEANIHVIPIAADDPSAEATARASLTSQFAAFDAANSKCFKPEDKDRLLKVVHESFGHYDVFNEIVRKVMVSKLQAAEHRSSDRRSSTRNSERCSDIS